MPEPLHPAVVHFPIVLAFLAPLAAVALLWAIQSGRLTRQAWVWVVVLQAAVMTTGWLAAEAGEREEERVERVVAEERIEEHEEGAERFLAIAGLALVIAFAGVLREPVGSVARALTVVAGVVALGAVAAVGHSGGELVYRHGAALAYSQPDSAAVAASGPHRAHEDDDHDDD